MSKRRVEIDEPRLLAQNPGMQRRDYVDPHGKSMRGEPEAISEAEQERQTRQARDTFAITHAEEQARRDVKSLKAQLGHASARALKRGVDLSPELERVRSALADAQRRLDSA